LKLNPKIASTTTSYWEDSGPAAYATSEHAGSMCKLKHRIWLKIP